MYSYVLRYLAGLFIPITSQLSIFSLNSLTNSSQCYILPLILGTDSLFHLSHHFSHSDRSFEPLISSSNGGAHLGPVCSSPRSPWNRNCLLLSIILQCIPLGSRPISCRSSPSNETHNLSLYSNNPPQYSSFSWSIFRGTAPRGRYLGLIGPKFSSGPYLG